MKHAREDYNRIQDPAGKIPQEEPVFLIRGQDVSAPSTLRHWADQNEANGGCGELSLKARIHARQMEEWQAQNGSKAADEP